MYVDSANFLGRIRKCKRILQIVSGFRSYKWMPLSSAESATAHKITIPIFDNSFADTMKYYGFRKHCCGFQKFACFLSAKKF